MHDSIERARNSAEIFCSTVCWHVLALAAGGQRVDYSIGNDLFVSCKSPRCIASVWESQLSHALSLSLNVFFKMELLF
jgi:hypothetical protein